MSDSIPAAGSDGTRDADLAAGSVAGSSVELGAISDSTLAAESDGTWDADLAAGSVAGSSVEPGATSRARLDADAGVKPAGGAAAEAEADIESDDGWVGAVRSEGGGAGADEPGDEGGAALDGSVSADLTPEVVAEQDPAGAAGPDPSDGAPPVEAGSDPDAAAPSAAPAAEPVETDDGAPPAEEVPAPTAAAAPGDLGAGTSEGGSAGAGAGGVPAAEPAEAVPAGEPEELEDPARLRAAVEAVLLVVDTPTGAAGLAQVLGRPLGEVERALRELQAEYDAGGRGMDLREVADGWRLYSREDFARYVERFVLDGQQARLTQAALETLAVIAYRQPVTRSRIAGIRGVSVDAVMRTLLTRGLVEECGADPDTGGGLYQTTRLFLEKVGLRSLNDLPSLAPLLPDTSQLDDVATST